MNTYSTNGRVEGDRNFNFSIVPGSPMADQIASQITGIDAKIDEIVVLHPIPGVGSSSVAFLRGRNNTFPTITMVGPDGVMKGEFNLHDFRHNTVRPARKAMLETEDNVVENAVIIVNSSGRELPPHQLDELKKLANTDELVIATLQLGQIDLGRSDMGEWIVETLTTALKSAGIGKSIATRPVIAITAGLSPVNAVIMTALHALCESWASQPVAERHEDGTFHFADLIRLAEMEDLGRTITTSFAPVLIPREKFNVVLGVLSNYNETSLVDELIALAKK